MEISSYKKDPQLFLSGLDSVELDKLQGSSSSELKKLVKLLQEKKIIITATYDKKIDSNPFADIVVTENEVLLKKVLAYFLPADSKNPGGQYDLQIKAGFEQLHKLINDVAAAAETKFTLREFLAATHFFLTPDRIDDDVIAAMLDAMGSHSSKRDTLKHEVGKLTAELRTYSVIQSEISTAQQHNGTIQVNKNGINLFDYKHYGYSSHADFVRKDANGQYNPQYQLLKDIATERNIDPVNLSKDSPVFLSIKDFLLSPKKDTGALSDVKDSYKYEKDNNPLSNFATTVGDRAKPLNDKLGQKTTELNDISSRYNAVIEALNRFIQKYESVMQQILQAI
ncbi:virulence-associated V antigen [Aeromonas veronii]|uniref:virulence-associated V antigen n=1 Tax=Aeromonas veronii TaxID=654 RepID=UPI0035B75D55